MCSSDGCWERNRWLFTHSADTEQYHHHAWVIFPSDKSKATIYWQCISASISTSSWGKYLSVWLLQVFAIWKISLSFCCLVLGRFCTVGLISLLKIRVHENCMNLNHRGNVLWSQRRKPKEDWARSLILPFSYRCCGLFSCFEAMLN